LVWDGCQMYEGRTEDIVAKTFWVWEVRLGYYIRCALQYNCTLPKQPRGGTSLHYLSPHVLLCGGDEVRKRCYDQRGFVEMRGKDWENGH
jgi:hypothetical protein